MSNRDREIVVDRLISTIRVIRIVGVALLAQNATSQTSLVLRVVTLQDDQGKHAGNADIFDRAL